MTILKSQPRNEAKDPMPAVAIQLFRHLAMDLGLEKNTEVQRAVGLLTSRKYRSFLSVTDSWAKQKHGSPADHFAWNQLACLLKKYPFVDPSIDTERAAMVKFHHAEHVCKRVNLRFSLRRKRKGRPLPYESYLHEARRWIERTIGVAPEYGKIWDMCDFGPGASVGISGSITHTARKLCEDWTCTPLAVPYAKAAMIGDHHIWELLVGSPVCYDKDLFNEAFDRKLSFVSGNKIITVPKTALVDRTIAIEPSLNGFLQKGVDNYLKRRLKRMGYDLTDQDRNQRLAKLGSEGGFNPLCTIDLAAASDTVSREIVKELLPPDWYDFLNNLRSHRYTTADGQEARYEKFTSMGNGFCFPLETLIFASIVHSVYAVTGDSVSAVYGDDIIVQQSSALLILEVLKYCGFSANVDKTFIHGEFRESCGADYFGGVNVRPYYLDDVPRSWGDHFGILNGLKRSLHLAEGLHSWDGIYSLIPEHKRYVRFFDGPDTAITVALDTFMASKHSFWSVDEQRWSWRELLLSPVSDKGLYNTAALMYGVVRGSASRRGSVDLTHRRKTITRTRKC